MNCNLERSCINFICIYIKVHIYNLHYFTTKSNFLPGNNPELSWKIDLVHLSINQNDLQ